MQIDPQLEAMVRQIPSMDLQSFIEHARLAFADKVITTSQFVCAVLSAGHQLASMPIVSEDALWKFVEAVVGAADNWLTTSYLQRREDDC